MTISQASPLSAITKNTGLAERITLAQDLMTRANWLAASQLWEDIIALGNPKMPEGVWARLCDAYRKQSKPDLANFTLQRAVENSVWNIQCFTIAAQSMADATRFSEAIEIARQCAEEAPAESTRLEGAALMASLEARRKNLPMALHIAEKMASASTNAPSRDAFRFARSQIEMVSQRLAAKDQWEHYWRQRADFVYLHVIRRLIEIVAPSARVVADIGSNRTPILDFHPSNAKRYSVDIDNPYQGENVIAIRQDFYIWNCPEPIDVVTCFQVIEHVPDPEKFVQRLLAIGEVVILSVPFMEPPGLNPGHINNNIDLATIIRWAHRKPNFHYIATELSGDQRIICLFDTKSEAPTPRLNAESEAALRYRHRWS